MSTNKVEMSLDEIIKANRKKDNATRANGRKGVAGRNNIAKRKPAFKGKKNVGGVQKRRRATVQGRKNVNNNRFKKNALRKIKNKNFRTKNQAAVKVNTVATKRLVQNLVKKALAHRNNGVSATLPSHRRRGGVRVVKKTVVLNRVSPKSRVIGQRRGVVSVLTAKQQRAPIHYNTVPQTVQIMHQSPVRRNYAPVQQRKFIDRRPVVVQQRAPRPGYQLMQVPLGEQNRIGTVRQQINAMRRNTVYVRPQQRHVQPRFRQRKQRVTYVQEQQPQQRRRFQNRRQQNYSPFFEPQNFLQRVPVQKQSRRYQ